MGTIQLENLDFISSLIKSKNNNIPSDFIKKPINKQSI